MQMRPIQVGVLVPWVNTAMEEELPGLVDSRIGLHWARLRPAALPRDGHDTSYVDGMRSALPSAVSEFDGMHLDSLVIGCTSLLLAGTEPSLITRTSGARPFRVITAFDAILERLERTPASRILLLAPYDRITLEREADLLEMRGHDVVERVQLEYEQEIRFIEPDYLCEILMRHYSDAVDCAVFSCTGLYTLNAIGKLAGIMGNRCVLVSSNTAIAASLNDMVGTAR